MYRLQQDQGLAPSGLFASSIVKMAHCGSCEVLSDTRSIAGPPGLSPFFLFFF